MRAIFFIVVALLTTSFAGGGGLAGGLDRTISSVVGVLPAEIAAGASRATSRMGGNAGGETAVVERVLDGDTVILRGWRERVRLANIDAPEMAHGHRQPGQPFSVQSTKWLTRKVQGKPVAVRCVDEDHYGRQICNLYLQGEHVNRELVRAGLAWANTASARYLRDKSILAVQREAQEQRHGLWVDGQPVAPWKWRKECWRGGVCGTPAH